MRQHACMAAEEGRPKMYERKRSGGGIPPLNGIRLPLEPTHLMFYHLIEQNWELKF